MDTAFVVRSTAFVTLFSAILFFEWFAPSTPSEQKKPYRVGFHLSLSIMNTIALNILLVGTLFATLLYTQKNEIGLTYLLGISGGAEIILTLIVLDFWDYWMHLVNHKIGFLWRFHKAHHSDMEMDVTTSSRFHIGELLISNVVKCLMILAWGPSLWGLVLFDTLLTGFSQFHHGNVGIPLRIQDRIEMFFVTPRMHRCHHSLHCNCFNTNFSTIFSFWDRLFGSYHWATAGDELKPIGLYEPRGPHTMKLLPFLMTPVKSQAARQA